MTDYDKGWNIGRAAGIRWAAQYLEDYGVYAEDSEQVKDMRVEADRICREGT